MRPTRVPTLLTMAALLTGGCQGGGPQADSTGASTSRVGDSERDCGVGPGDVQIAAGLGVLRIGTIADHVRERCEIVRDTTVLDNEGMAARELVISLGADTAVAEVQSDSVWRLRLTSRRFRTGAGLGIGSSVSDLAANAGARALVGEGEIYVTVPATCGVSYRIAEADFGRVASAPSAERAMDLLPDTARVDLLLVVGCGNQPGS